MLLDPQQLNEAIALGWRNPHSPLLSPLCLPVLGLTLNVVVQVVLLRLARGRGFLRTIAAGFAAGMVLTLLCHLALSRFWYLAPQPSVFVSLTEWLLLVAPSYAGLGYGYANFANLGNASIRIRLYEDLQASPDGLRLEDIHRTYNENAILENRLKRLTEGGDLVETNGTLKTGRKRFVLLGGIIFTAKKWILGKHSEFETHTLLKTDAP